MAEFDHLQQILGTNNKNRVFSVFRHSQTSDFHVYYGAELFEIVPGEREDTRFKLMVAHLHCAGAKLTELQRSFKVDPRTIGKWSKALRSGDAEELARALAGRQYGRKLTPAAEEYVRIRFPSIYAEDRYTYSRRIRRELRKVLKTELSAETLRPLFRELKAPFEQREEEESGDSAGVGEGTPPEPTGSAGEQAEPELGSGQGAQEAGEELGSPEQAAGNDPGEPEAWGEVRESAKPCEALDSEERSALANRRSNAGKSMACWCSHLGLLLFSQPLFSLRQALGERDGPVVSQWASQVLLGARNLEQTKLQSRRDLSLMLGGGLLGSPDHQRKKLAELAADPHLARDILRWNFQRVGGEKMSVFYFDPHTKHYTGKQNVLKGWCPKIRWADKVMHGDFVHSTDGHPLYVENTDNYEDMRQRFRGLEKRFRDSLDIGEERELTWVIDRGIFSEEIFEWVLDSPAKHLITWEKGYKLGRWHEGKPAAGSMRVERARNNKADKRTWRFEWIEEKWPGNTRLRRIIVRALNPEGNRVEVSILCDDPDRPAREIVWLMFNRWIQENDFKYLDVHFGINEITSYQSETYAQISGELKDREMKSVAYTALLSARRDEKNRMGKLLVLQRESGRKEEKRIGLIAQLKALKKPSREQRRKLGRLKGAQKSAERYAEKREEKIERIQEEIDRLEARMESTDKEVSRLDTLIGRGVVRLCGDRKQLMDVIKITARNLFYEKLAPFKDAYDNYRDDHVWFRHLSQSGGVIVPGAEGVMRGYLIGDADLPKPVRAEIGKLLVKFNRSDPRLPDGSGCRMVLELGSKSAIELASTNP